MSLTVLIVGSDKATTTAYANCFDKKEYDIVTAHSGRQALAQAKSHSLDAIVVDTTVPRLNCKAVCRKLRGETSAPVILIALPNSKIDGAIVTAGIVHKPVVAKKLIACIKAAIESKPPRLLTVGPISLDLEKHKLLRGSKTLALTPKQFALLKLLMSRVGQTVTRKTLMREVWNTDYLEDTRTLDVHIHWVREKVEENPSKPRYLLTVRGQGYKFVVEWAIGQSGNQSPD